MRKPRINWVQIKGLGEYESTRVRHAKSVTSKSNSAYVTTSWINFFSTIPSISVSNKRTWKVDIDRITVMGIKDSLAVLYT